MTPTSVLASSRCVAKLWRSVTDAAEAALRAAPDLDVAEALSGLLALGLVTAFTAHETGPPE